MHLEAMHLDTVYEISSTDVSTSGPPIKVVVFVADKTLGQLMLSPSVC